MENKLFVGNLAWSTTEDDLKQYFGQFGAVQQVEVMRDRFTDRARGFAFVTFASNEEALNAVNNTEGKEFLGRPLKVNIARPREERPEGERRSFDRGPRSGGGGGFRPRRPFGGGGGGGGDDRSRRRFNDRPREDRGGDRFERRERSGGYEGGGYGDSNY